MNEMQQPYPGYQPRRFPWGCLLGGCLGVVLLMVIGGGLVGFVGYRFYSEQIAKYTSETPVELPVVELSEQEMAALESKVDEFKTKLEKGEAEDPLVLTEDEVNAFISREEDFKGRVHVSIENEQIIAEVSVPTDALPGAQGRFFNGSVVLDASLENGVLIVRAQEASVNGETVPDEFMVEVRKQNLAKDAYKDPESAEWLRRFESMEIVGDTIVLTPAQKVSSSADDAPQENERSDGEVSNDQSTDQQQSAETPTDAADPIDPGN